MPIETVRAIRMKKEKGEKIACLTAYDAPTGKLLEEAGIDIVLVGDSVGNVILGYENTILVTVQEMVHHIKAVKRGVKHSLIVGDMPLSAFEKGEEDAYKNAVLFIEAGAEAVKIEGTEHLELIKKLVSSDIPVMGHIGFTPQSEGIPAVHGKTQAETLQVLEESKLLEDAGVFSIVLELVERNAAKTVTESLKVPTISCGSGPFCDGQVLVTNDIVGLYPGKVPKFVKQYADLGDQFKKAVSTYISEVKEGKFPV
ncbi:MAG: 3-methyl-2-oxobutanoate hydroxymethyltransferase [Candidatus Saganbacteria bacterium]|nr:3-methyl-2-oxobutanoate hydroxymethyltransferase [Candidatus Saganbacteria bacterium]